MYDVFCEVFGEVMEQMDCEWWELFDSSDFSRVEERLVSMFGESVLDSDEFLEWVEEMAMDL